MIMKRIFKATAIAAAVLVLVGLGISAGYTHTVSKEVRQLRRENRSDIVYLRTRVRELEAELTASLMGKLLPPAEAVDGEAIDPSEESAEAVTIPAHKSPETQPSAEETTAEAVDTAAPAAMYILTEHDGVIGVFDAAGELIQTVNVFTLTLPESEREALKVGIPAYSHEEMRAMVEQYE